MKVPLLVGGNSNVLVFRYTGNGSATFDPSITTSASVSVSWKPDDAPETVTTGTTHNFSYTPSAGSHVCIVRVAGGLGLVTAIDIRNDAIIRAQNVERLTSCTSFIAQDNGVLVLRVASIPRGSAVLNVSYCYFVTGSVAELPPNATTIQTQGAPISGSVADTPAVSQVVYYYYCTGITPGSIAHLTAIRDIRIYSMWADAASVDTVIESIWDARANYTYATPSLQIGGTNPAPTGNYIAPEEGPDWHNDGSKWIPLTPNAKAFDLGNDVNAEGFNTWTITKN